MINLILKIQITICIVLSLLCWLIIFNINRLKSILRKFNLSEKQFAQKVHIARQLVGKEALTYLFKEIIWTPSSFFILLEIIALSKSQKLSKTSFLKTILGKT